MENKCKEKVNSTPRRMLLKSHWREKWKNKPNGKHKFKLLDQLHETDSISWVISSFWLAIMFQVSKWSLWNSLKPHLISVRRQIVLQPGALPNNAECCHGLEVISCLECLSLSTTSFFPHHPPSLTFPSCPLRLNPCHYQWQLRYWKAYITLRGCKMTICAAQLLSDPQMWWYACAGVWLHPSIDPSWDYYFYLHGPYQPPSLSLLGPAEPLGDAVTQQGSLLKPLSACACVRADTITPISLLAEHRESRVGMRWRSLLRKLPMELE